jgi:putative sterol carrier protein
MSMPSTAREFIEAMPLAFQSEKARGVKAAYQFELTGEGGGKWVVEIAEGECRVREGTTASPDVTLTMSASDYVAIAKGELDPVKAFMGGRIKFKGNMSLLMKLPTLFKR